MYLILGSIKSFLESLRNTSLYWPAFFATSIILTLSVNFKFFGVLLNNFILLVAAIIAFWESLLLILGILLLLPTEFLIFFISLH